MKIAVRLGLVGLAALLLITAGCANDGQPTTGATTTAPSAATSPSPTETGTPSPTGPATTVTADLVEFGIELSTGSFSPGVYTFVASQAGQSPHALSIKGPGVDETTPVIQPGGASQPLTVILRPGSYELWCPVGNHRALGMDMTITVE